MKRAPRAQTARPGAVDACDKPDLAHARARTDGAPGPRGEALKICVGDAQRVTEHIHGRALPYDTCSPVVAHRAPPLWTRRARRAAHGDADVAVASRKARTAEWGRMRADGALATRAVGAYTVAVLAIAGADTPAGRAGAEPRTGTRHPPRRGKAVAEHNAAAGGLVDAVIVVANGALTVSILVGVGRVGRAACVAQRFPAADGRTLRLVVPAGQDTQKGTCSYVYAAGSRSVTYVPGLQVTHFAFGPAKLSVTVPPDPFKNIFYLNYQNYYLKLIYFA